MKNQHHLFYSIVRFFLSYQNFIFSVECSRTRNSKKYLTPKGSLSKSENELTQILTSGAVGAFLGTSQIEVSSLIHGLPISGSLRKGSSTSNRSHLMAKLWTEGRLEEISWGDFHLYMLTVSYLLTAAEAFDRL